MRTAYKCRAYPDIEQVSVLNRTFGCVRVVWNRTLAWRHARYQGEQTRTDFAQANAYLTAMKASDGLDWLNEVSSVRFSRRSGTSRSRSATSSPGAPVTRGTSPATAASPRSTPAPGSGTAIGACSWPR